MSQQFWYYHYKAFLHNGRHNQTKAGTHCEERSNLGVQCLDEGHFITSQKVLRELRIKPLKPGFVDTPLYLLMHNHSLYFYNK